MDSILEHFKEIISITDEKCNGNCSSCILSKTIKEIWYNDGYDEITICGAIELIRDHLK